MSCPECGVYPHRMDCSHRNPIPPGVPGPTDRPMQQMGRFWMCQTDGCYRRLQLGSYCSRCGVEPVEYVWADQ